MAKTSNKKDEPKAIFHASHITKAEKKDGNDYTYDWDKVTHEPHLAIRNKELLDAKAAKESGKEVAVSADGGPVQTP